MIIDAHCHAGRGDGLTGPWDTRASLAAYLGRAEACGIHRTAVWSVFHSDYRKANAQVAKLLQRHPKRLYAFAFLHPSRDQGRIQHEVARLVHKYGFVGIKVHRHDGAITRELCDVARRFSLPITYDVQGKVGQVELLALEYPDVNFIIPHLGSFSDDWQAQVALIDHLVRHPNIYTDTAGVRRFDNLQAAVKRAGPKKILFGSDGPWLHPAVELAKVRALQLPARAERLILGGNFLRLTRAARQRARHGVRR